MIWKDIHGYEGKYIISERGDIKRLRFVATRPNRWGGYNNYTMSEMPMKSRCLDGRYLSTCLLQKLHMVHRLVAMAFIPNEHSKPFVNHKDCNRKNNHYTNLEWCTGQENMDHASYNGLLNYVSAKKLTPALVKEIKGIPKEVSSIKISKVYNVSSGVIRRIRRNEIWSYI
jgi:hypothetical protein